MSSEHFRQIQSDFEELARLLKEGIRDLDSEGAEKPEVEALARAKRGAERGAGLARKGSDLT